MFNNRITVVKSLPFKKRRIEVGTWQLFHPPKQIHSKPLPHGVQSVEQRDKEEKTRLHTQRVNAQTYDEKEELENTLEEFQEEAPYTQALIENYVAEQKKKYKQKQEEKQKENEEKEQQYETAKESGIIDDVGDPYITETVEGQYNAQLKPETAKNVDELTQRLEQAKNEFEKQTIIANELAQLRELQQKYLDLTQVLQNPVFEKGTDSHSRLMQQLDQQLTLEQMKTKQIALQQATKLSFQSLPKDISSLYLDDLETLTGENIDDIEEIISRDVVINKFMNELDHIQTDFIRNPGNPELQNEYLRRCALLQMAYQAYKQRYGKDFTLPKHLQYVHENKDFQNLHLKYNPIPKEPKTTFLSLLKGALSYFQPKK